MELLATRRIADFQPLRVDPARPARTRQLTGDVFIVASQSSVRGRLRGLLAETSVTCRELPSRSAARQVARDYPSACLLIYLNEVTADVLSWLQSLAAWSSIVLVAPQPAPDLMLALGRVGVFSFVPEPEEREALHRAVAAALADSAAKLPQRMQQANAWRCLDQLTKREREVAARMLEGLPTKQIAFCYAISPKTVEVHRRKIRRKTGAENIAQLVKILGPVQFELERTIRPTNERPS